MGGVREKLDEQRRRLLRGAAAVALPQVLWPWRPARAERASSTVRIRPSDSAWPAASSWEKLNREVGGNLIAVKPLLGACTVDPNAASCLETLGNLRNPYYLGDQPGGTQVSGWLDAWTPATSVYAVAARSAAHVAAAVNFARKNNLRLAIKGGGHSYQGTSNAADSLLIWTRAMKEIVLHNAFVSKGCRGRHVPMPAVSVGAGAMWMDVYDAVTTRGGRYVQGGGCATVGVAGLIQSGGFGSFSKGFGIAAAGLIEAEVVTADGQVRTVNACNDADLFWALKGGGGGSFGVVTRVTLRTYELPDYFCSAEGTIKAASDDAFRRLLEQFAGFYAARLHNPHWGETVSIRGSNTLHIGMEGQGLDRRQAAQAWQPFFDWVTASPQDFTVTAALKTDSVRARHYWDADYLRKTGDDSLISDPRPGAPAAHVWWADDKDQAGAFILGYGSVWLPASLLTESGRARLAGALFAASRHWTVGLHFNKGLAGAPADVIAAARSTATHAAASDAFALAIVGGEAPAAYPGMPELKSDQIADRKRQARIAEAVTALRSIVPGAASYVSESDYFEPTWQQSFWGANYPRLRAIKARYDPDGLFIVHHGVGSEDWSADGFSRVQRQP
jgi:FAD/FMN-containing dehydrogenase